jgi:hydroxymethylpyrimidine/phosphomethylpyrimidine kinase
MSVLDPVMISTSGHTLLPDDATEALKGLFEVVDWLTPNVPEAQRLSGGQQGSEVDGAKGLVRLAKETAERCNVPIVLLKGGHSPVSREDVKGLGDGYRIIWEEGDDEEDTIECLKIWRKSILPEERSDKVVLDILVQQGSSVPTLFVGKYVESSSTHGTGCTLSSAIAAAYAKLPEGRQGESFPRCLDRS